LFTVDAYSATDVILKHFQRVYVYLVLRCKCYCCVQI